MLLVKDGSKVNEILKIVAMTGEFPSRAVKLLGDYVAWRRRIKDMTQKQVYKNQETNETYECVALTIAGEGSNKSIRLTKNAMPLLEWIGERELYEKTIERFNGAAKSERTHRVAEAILMFHLTGVPVQKIGNPKKGNLPVFLTSKTNREAVKNCLDQTKMNETELTMFTRVIGLFMNQGTCMVVYNTRDAKMKWALKSEAKTKGVYLPYASRYCAAQNIDALFFGSNYSVGYETMTNVSHMDIKQKDSTIFELFRNAYFVPLDDFGKKLMRVITTPDFPNKLLGILMPEKNRRSGYSLFEYDGILNGQYVFSFLDSNVARLNMFRIAMDVHFKREPAKYGIPKIVCYYEQESFVRELFAGCEYEITRISIDTVLKKVGG